MGRTFVSFVVGTAFLMLAAGTPIQAQGDEKSELVARLIEMMKMEEMMEQTTVTMSDQIVTAVLQSDPNVNPRVLEIIVEVAEEEFPVLMDQVIPQLMDKMGGYYTVSELREMIAFYETPLGQKAISLMPVIATDTQEVLGALLPGFQERMTVKMQDRLRAEGFQ